MAIYDCDPAKNNTCDKTNCFVNGGGCKHTTKEECKMENEIRFYLKAILEVIDTEEFKPQYIVTAVKLPTGAIELAVNTNQIKEKIEYILKAYDEDMHLKTNDCIEMVQVMVV